MTTRLVTSLAAILLWTGAARAQHRLTSELADQIQKGIGRLTEVEVLRLVPGPVTVSFGGQALDSDYLLTWQEVRRIRVEFVEGKASATTGTFSDVVDSKTLTLENLKKIARGMKQEDVEKLLSGRGGSFKGSSAKNSNGIDIEVCEWEEGREIRAYIKGGKVSGAGYLSSAR